MAGTNVDATVGIDVGGTKCLGVLAAVIFLFLRNFRSTLIVCTAIPISMSGHQIMKAGRVRPMSATAMGKEPLIRLT